jgi:LuxR family maltose regulon positive regulatory protein
MRTAIELAAQGPYRSPFLLDAGETMDLLVEMRNEYPRFVDDLRALQDSLTKSSPQARLDRKGAIHEISRREREILTQISAGLSNTEIAERLFISVGTVKWHLNNIFGKVDAKNRMQAVLRARQLGVLD